MKPEGDTRQDMKHTVADCWGGERSECKWTGGKFKAGDTDAVWEQV